MSKISQFANRASDSTAARETAAVVEEAVATTFAAKTAGEATQERPDLLSVHYDMLVITLLDDRIDDTISVLH